METNKAKAIAWIQALELFRNLNADMTTVALQIFFTIAATPGLTQVEIAEKLELGTSTTSRIILGLFRKELGIVRQEEDSEDSRLKRVFLTEKGERFLQRVQELT